MEVGRHVEGGVARVVGNHRKRKRPLLQERRNLPTYSSLSSKRECAVPCGRFFRKGGRTHKRGVLRSRGGGTYLKGVAGRGQEREEVTGPFPLGERKKTKTNGVWAKTRGMEKKFYVHGKKESHEKDE